MNYTDFKLRKMAEAQATPDEDFDNTWELGSSSPHTEPFQYKPRALLEKDLTRHYAKLLAMAMKRAGLAPVKDVTRLMRPKFSYAITRAANIDKDILGKLKPWDREELAGSSFSGYNLSPELAADVVDTYNVQNELQDGMYTHPDDDIGTQKGKPIGLYTKGLLLKKRLAGE